MSFHLFFVFYLPLIDPYLVVPLPEADWSSTSIRLRMTAENIKQRADLPCPTLLPSLPPTRRRRLWTRGSSARPCRTSKRPLPDIRPSSSRELLGSAETASQTSATRVRTCFRHGSTAFSIGKNGGNLMDRSIASLLSGKVTFFILIGSIFIFVLISLRRQHSWGAGEIRSRTDQHNNDDGRSIGTTTANYSAAAPSSTTSSPPLSTSHQAATWMSSYASDPSLPTTEPPLGLVRMQREALLEKTHQQQRRSLPEEKPPPSSSYGSVPSTIPPLNRSVSDSTSGSVMRLRRELEAKAAFPLTGSFAPPPLVVAALAAALTSPLSSPTRTTTSTCSRRPGRPRTQAETRLRKRSLSLEKVSTYSDLATANADWNRAAQAAADEVDLNVKLLVGMFETPSSSSVSRRAMERPRGWSESSMSGSPHHRRPSSSASFPSSSGHSTTAHHHQRRSLTSKPPVPDPPAASSSDPSLRKFAFGKPQHPMDRLPSTARQKLAQQPVFGTM